MGPGATPTEYRGHLRKTTFRFGQFERAGARAAERTDGAVVEWMTETKDPMECARSGRATNAPQSVVVDGASLVRRDDAMLHRRDGLQLRDDGVRMFRRSCARRNATA